MHLTYAPNSVLTPLHAMHLSLNSNYSANMSYLMKCGEFLAL